MNERLLAALASPPPARKNFAEHRSGTKQERASFQSRRTNDKENGRAISAGGRHISPTAPMVPFDNGTNTGSVAPAYTVPPSPSAPGRMENLRVLIEDAKRAAAEGRLAAALRKYETAMVTLPEAYKPRLRRKIAKLEAQLDDEEDGTPATPARSSRACRDGVEYFEQDLGPLDLLHVAVQDVAAAAGTSERNTSALSTFSPRRSSPLVRSLASSTVATVSSTLASSRRATSSMSDTSADSIPAREQGRADIRQEPGRDRERQHVANDIPRVSRKLATKLAISANTKRVDRAGSSSNPEVGDTGKGKLCKRDGAGHFDKADPEAVEIRVTGDENFGLGAAGDVEKSGDVGPTQSGVGDQERRRAMNKGLSDKLEDQVVATMNQASSEELTELHGIGPRRAQLILQKREVAPFKSLADLSRIGMYPKEIEKMGKHNMLECLDVFPVKADSTRTDNIS